MNIIYENCWKNIFIIIIISGRIWGLGKDSPESRPVQVIGKIEKMAVANGLHITIIGKLLN